MVAHTHNPSLDQDSITMSSKVYGKTIIWAEEFEAGLDNIVRCYLQKTEL